MGPMQYMVVSFDGNHFTGEIIPELQSLCEQELIRIIDLVFITRDARGDVSSRELVDLFPGHSALLSSSSGPEDSWFAQDDIDLVGESLPDNCSVALLLFEHLWASRLEDAVRRANGSLIAEGMPSREVANQIERMLTLGV